VGNTSRRLSFFVMVLCHSRMMYLEFTVSETMEHFLAAHANAFAFFGGVPARCMVDNLKSAVLQRAVGEAPVLNPRYKDFADHHGFAVSPCGVGQAHEKGRVENAVGYVKKNFLAGLEPTDFSQLNPAAPPVARRRGQRPFAWHHQTTAGGSVCNRAAGAAAASLTAL
jgi:transposase